MDRALTAPPTADRTTAARAGTRLALASGLVAAALPFLVLALLRASDGPGLEADDYGQYLMHAEALADGRPYGDIGYIFSAHSRFIGPRMAPPGVPLVLAPVLAVFGRNLVAIKALLLCFAVAFVLLAGRYFAVHDEKRLGLAVALLCGLSPDVVHASTQALSDVPFAATIWAVILLYERPGQWRAGRMLAATLLIAWAVLFRPIGTALLPAAGLFAALRFREHGLRPAVPALVLAVAGLLVVLAFPGQLPALDINPSRIQVWLRVNQWGLANLQAYRLSVFESHLYPFPWTRPNDLYHILSVGLMFVGLAAWLRHSWRRFAAAFAAVYVGALLTLPFAQERYMWPLFPLSIFGLVNGVRVVASLLRSARPVSWAVRPAVAFAIILAVLGAVQVASQPRRRGLADIPEVQEVIAHLQQLAQREEVRVVYYKPRSFAWESGIPTMPAIRTPTDETLAELERKRISHVVLADREAPEVGGAPGIRHTIAAAPDAFSLEFRNSSFVVYRFRAARAAGAAPAQPQ